MNTTPNIADPPDEIFLQLNAEGRAAQDDVAWIDEQFNQGAFVAFRGEWIAVVNKQLLGHDKSLKRLREDVARATGHSPNRIVTTFVERPNY